ncbi:MAG TPA: hypothetical protein VHX42_02735, partial [Candidatus Babeliales bacterium]|nr:hypothetical protein [Candidatus Babeliales bacterium]
RDNSPSGANTPSVSGNQVDTVVNVDKLGKEPITSNFSLQAYDDTPQMYTEAYVWYVVQTSNPVLWKFAQDNKLSLEKTLLIGQLKKELDVSPDVCVDYINKLKSADKKTVITAEEYAKVQKKDPQKYKEMIYEILTSLLHEQEGKDTSTSPLANTHIQLAEQKITDQDDSLKKRCGGWITTIVGAIVTGIGLGAWGLYGQLTKMNEAPTMMPTMMPVAPTFPTFEPTIAPT